MSYREVPPPPALRPFVDRFWTRASGGGEESFRVLPDGCMDVLISERRAFVVGTMSRALLVESRAAVRTVAVRFRPGGASPFLRAHAHEFTDRNVDAEDAGLSWLEAARIREASTLEEGVRRLESALVARLGSVASPDPLVAHAVRRLFGPTPPSIAELARQIGWSRQHLARRFRAQVGVGPKELGKVARLQRAVACLQGDGTHLARAAVSAGYFDEPHMARDFRELIGLSPGAVQAASGSIRPIQSLLAVP